MDYKCRPIIIPISKREFINWFDSHLMHTYGEISEAGLMSWGFDISKNQYLIYFKNRLGAKVEIVELGQHCEIFASENLPMVEFLPYQGKSNFLHFLTEELERSFQIPAHDYYNLFSHFLKSAVYKHKVDEGLIEQKNQAWVNQVLTGKKKPGPPPNRPTDLKLKAYIADIWRGKHKKTYSETEKKFCFNAGTLKNHLSELRKKPELLEAVKNELSELSELSEEFSHYLSYLD